MKFNIGDAPMGKCESLDVLAKNLKHELKGKRFFLVLDDVWNDETSKWETIENCLMINDSNKGSKILVTTRSKQVASIMSSISPIQLDGLTSDVFWSLFQKYAFDITKEYPPELEEIAMKIMTKLNGSPLAAKTVGRILSSNRTKRHWENVLNSELWTLTQKKNEIMPALRLSYQYLPEYLKPCFAFCSLYPKDYVYDKKQMIYMWMALGYIQNQCKEVLMEEVGEEYVKELLNRSMFQPCTDNDLSYEYACDNDGFPIVIDANEKFKIHDLIHDLAKMVSANESVMVQDEYTLKYLSSSIRNLSIFIDENSWSWNRYDFYDHIKNIRTLIFLTKNKITNECSSSISNELCDFLQKSASKMKFLRVLDLSYIDIEDLKLPKIKHLRYLDLHNTGVKTLPSSLEHLYQLQVLKCDKLQSAPPINLMENLRHIRGFHVNTTAVPNLGNFHFLQELKLDVSKQQKLFSTKEKNTHKLKGLQGMKWMRELSLYKLQNVESKEEAAEAELKSMDHLTMLTLAWDSNHEGNNNSEEILEALHPGPNVAVLKIRNYNGTKYPSWMENLSLLQKLYLRVCQSIRYIRTRELKKIKHLKFISCSELRIQDGCQGFGALTCLERLVIEDCRQLTTDLFTDGRGGLPSSLKEICLWDVGDTRIDVSSTILQRLTNLTCLTVGFRCGGSVTPSTSNPPETQQLQQLRDIVLAFQSAQQLKEWLLQLQGCTSVVRIELGSSSSRMETFNTETENALVSFVALRELWLVNFEDCRSLPTRLCEISSLKELYIMGCPKIERLREGGLPAGLQILDITRCPLLEEYLKKVRHELPSQLEVRFE